MAPETTRVADDEFRRRALAEAARYGSDALVFVRELLQNARDAGARRVAIEVSRQGAVDRVTCRDDGRGMTWEHARRYLFALYASSKEAERAEAGKFGIGFWSVLRFEPSRIIVRSRGEGDAWEVSLDGALERATAAKADLEAGTEVVLERPADPRRDLAAEVAEASRRHGRFLTLRDDPERPLPVTVDGSAVNAEFSLPAPSGAFRGRGFRGVVGLAAEPRVELFAHGLFVRAASSLGDLRDPGDLRDEGAAEDALAGLQSLAPRVLIDSAELDLLLARSDARVDRHLRRILKVAEKHLHRLITGQLQALRPQSRVRLFFGALRDRLEPHLGWHLAAAALVGVVLGSAALWWLPSGRLARAPISGPDASAAPAARTADGAPVDGLPAVGAQAVGLTERDDAAVGEESAAGSEAGPAGAMDDHAPAPPIGPDLEIHPYRDLTRSYRGPRPGNPSGDRSRLAMVYRPAAVQPYFAALAIDDLDGGDWAPRPAADGLPSYRGIRCSSDCLEVRLLLAEGQSTLRLPIATGHRLDTGSARLDGKSVEVFESAAGEAVLFWPSNAGRPGSEPPVLRYVTGPAAPPEIPPPPEPVNAPAELAEVAAALRGLPEDERVARALDWVARRVTYERAPAAARAIVGATGRGTGYVAAALDVGAGDCDVQSGVLATLLRLAGVEARLALGYVGAGGTVLPGLHAWVEVRDGPGGWRVADPSLALAEEAAESVAGPIEIPPLAASLRPQAAGAVGVASSRLAWVAALAAAATLFLALRRRAAVRPAPAVGAADLAALLGGALRHPEAFARLPAMFHGRFVPQVGRSGGLSLDRCRRLARSNRLFRSATGSRLALSAAGRGVPVIDASTAEGRVVSLALGAVDLDRWSSQLENSADTGWTRRINRRLDRLGAPWRLRQAGAGTPGGQPWIEIALEELKLGRRLILLDVSAPELAPARAQLADRPDAAAFSVLDALLHRLDVEPRERARILAAFARPLVYAASAPNGAAP